MLELQSSSVLIMIKALPSPAILGILESLKKNLLILVFALSANAVFSQSFSIGHTTKAFFDTTRNRTIATEIYYPSTSSGDDVAVASGKFPVLVVGHGFLMTYSAYQNFWEALVPEGYILCFPKTEGGILPNHGNFGDDLRFVAATMQNEDTTNASLFFNAVAQKTALMGHSMGGGASFLAAANNPNINALVNFAAAETNPSAISASASVTVPTLIFSGADDCVTPEENNQNKMYQNLTSACKTQVSIINGVHCYFANSNFNCSLGERFCNSSTEITRAQQQSVTFSFLKLWLQDKLYDNPMAQTDFNNLLQSSNQINYNQTCETLSSDGSESPKSITVFPNPVKNILNLQLLVENLGGDFTIYNSLGQQVLVTKILTKNTQLHISHLQAGFYFYIYSKNNSNESGKFVKDIRN